MPTLATLRRTLYALFSARFIELQKQRRRP
jgi:transcription initiation factor IIE alpha subunit